MESMMTGFVGRPNNVVTDIVRLETDRTAVRDGPVKSIIGSNGQTETPIHTGPRRRVIIVVGVLASLYRTLISKGNTCLVHKIVGRYDLPL